MSCISGAVCRLAWMIQWAARSPGVGGHPLLSVRAPWDQCRSGWEPLVVVGAGPPPTPALWSLLGLMLTEERPHSDQSMPPSSISPVCTRVLVPLEQVIANWGLQTTRICALTVLEAASLKSKCGQGRTPSKGLGWGPSCWLGAFLMAAGLVSVSIFPWPPPAFPSVCSL